MQLKPFLLLLLLCASCYANAQPAKASTTTDSALIFKERARTYSKGGQPDSGIYYGMKALPLLEQRNDLRLLAEMEWILASTYSTIRQYERSRVYCERGITHARQAGDSLYVGLILLTQSANLTHPNLGHVPVEVLELNRKALHLFEQLKDTMLMGHALGNIGVYFVESETQKNFDSAIYYYNLANEINLRYGRPQTVGVVYDNIARLLIIQKKYTEVIPYEMKAVAISLQTHDYEMLKKNYRKLLIVYTQLGEKDSVDNYIDKYVTARDSFFSGRLTQALSDAETKYETQKKQNRIEALTKDNLIQLLRLKNQDLEIGSKEYLIRSQQLMLLNDSLELNNQTEHIQIQEQANRLQQEQLQALQQQARIHQLELNNRRLEVNRKNLIIGLQALGFIILITLSLVLYSRFKRRKEAQLQAVIASEQQRATSALFEGEQQERIRIARDLHDSIGQMLSVIKMKVSALQGSVGTDNKELADSSSQLIDKTIAEVRSISHNLIPEELNFGLIKATEELCAQLRQSSKLRIQFRYDADTSALQLHKHAALPLYRILQEVLANMAKHAAATEIDILMQRRQQELEIAISDNGKGFDVSSLQNAGGIGWKNIRARVGLLNGSCIVESAPQSGTRVIIHIPHE